MKNTDIRTVVGSTQSEIKRKQTLVNRLRASQIPDSELLDNIGLYLTRQTLSRINFMQRIYQMIVPVHGVVMEFGVRWGQNLALFSALRGIHEPFNYNRKIIGFDTFTGFPSVESQDGGGVQPGDYGVIDGWPDELDEILDFHNQNAPIPHKKKYALVKGDATVTLPEYLKNNPETIVALAYFDFDIYQPTHDCLKAILPHLTKGSVLAFDELNTPEFPGETIALREVLGLSRYAIRRDPMSPLTSYLIIE
ncbi:crotonobetainyl-CoA--carnitine CoA-transferase [Thiolinea disciformis]|uniref:crotonobetainyl-CoA--carnitine CoA-transferase n=1 Tax=Thiolinea disciformis TaxID=125614 RepID=UPI0003697A95|nr:crotonobetainyl-CoA--carnitine CoA-transferase [Thiolinea disciformis]